MFDNVKYFLIAMAQEKLSHTFYLSYVTLLRQGKLQLLSAGANFNLTLIQTLTLLLMANVHELSMGDLGRLYACDASNVTGIVDGLEEKELVARQSCPGDRRIKMIVLTPAGKQLQARLFERLAAASDDIFTVLTPDERKQFVHLVVKVSNHLRAAEGGIFPQLTP